MIQASAPKIISLTPKIASQPILFNRNLSSLKKRNFAKEALFKLQPLCLEIQDVLKGIKGADSARDLISNLDYIRISRQRLSGCRADSQPDYKSHGLLSCLSFIIRVGRYTFMYTSMRKQSYE